jgi:hypothetical protein
VRFNCDRYGNFKSGIKYEVSLRKGKRCGRIELPKHLDSGVLEDMERYFGTYEMGDLVGPEPSCSIGLL